MHAHVCVHAHVYVHVRGPLLGVYVGGNNFICFVFIVFEWVLFVYVHALVYVYVYMSICLAFVGCSFFCCCLVCFLCLWVLFYMCECVRVYD